MVPSFAYTNDKCMFCGAWHICWYTRVTDRRASTTWIWGNKNGKRWTVCLCRLKQNKKFNPESVPLTAGIWKLTKYNQIVSLADTYYNIVRRSVSCGVSVRWEFRNHIWTATSLQLIDLLFCPVLFFLFFSICVSFTSLKHARSYEFICSTLKALHLTTFFPLPLSFTPIY